MQEIPDSDLRLYLRLTLKAMIAVAAISVLVVGTRYLGGGARETTHQDRFDLSEVAEGRTRTVGWDGRPVIVLHRAPATVRALGDSLADDPSPAWFVARAQGTATGCTIVWQRRRTRFRESCSEAAWDAGGRPLPGTDAGRLRVPPHRFADGDQLILGDTAD